MRACQGLFAHNPSLLVSAPGSIYYFLAIKKTYAAESGLVFANKAE